MAKQLARRQRKAKRKRGANKAAEIRETHAAGNAFDRMLATEDRHNRNVARKRKQKLDAAKAARKAAKKKAGRPAKPKPKKKPAQTFDYAAYLRSAHWRAKRREALEYHGAQCDRCGASEDLQVHHKTYARLGREKMKDLQILCGTCHTKLHEADPKWVARQERKKAVESPAA